MVARHKVEAMIDWGRGSCRRCCGAFRLYITYSMVALAITIFNRFSLPWVAVEARCLPHLSLLGGISFCLFWRAAAQSGGEHTHHIIRAPSIGSRIDLRNRKLVDLNTDKTTSSPLNPLPFLESCKLIDSFLLRKHPTLVPNRLPPPS